MSDKRLVFDLEADGLLKEATKVHCIAIANADTGDIWSYGPDEIEKGLQELYDADVLIAHNGIGYDLPLLRKLHNWNRRPGCRVIDTLVVSRLVYPNVKQEDFTRLNFDSKLIGSHSLRAWGIRLGEAKGDFEGPWDQWSEKMQVYCEQDVRVTIRLLRHCKAWEYPIVPLDLEHRIQHITFLMQQEGWTFHLKKAQDLYTRLMERRDVIERELVETFGQWEEVDRVIVPKRDNKRLGYTAGVPVTKYKTVVFNPGSRVHIEKKLREAGWEPQEFTDGGRAKLDEPILLRIDKPEAKLLVEYLLNQKRTSQIGFGDSGWLRLVGEDGRIHGTINPNGTITGRATHSSPNVSQVPSNRAPYGKECRACFGVPKGWKLVGSDMAGLELRTYAYYLSKFDKGEYAKIVTEGDPHTYNQQAAGLETRDQAKTFIYALLYGASSKKLGVICGLPEKDGAVLKKRYMDSMPAYAKLAEVVSMSAAKGYLTGLDGRKLHVRSQHSALNTLLQGAGACLTKTWVVHFFEQMCSRGYRHGYDGDFVVCGWIHDEIQVACKEELVDVVGDTLVSTAAASGDPYGFSVPLSASYSVGDNWSETH